METTSVVILGSDITMTSRQLQRINAIAGFTCNQLFTNVNEFLQSKIKADMVIIDHDKPFFNELSVIPGLLKKAPGISILIVSELGDVKHILEAISLGVVGYIDRSSFFECIETVLTNIKEEGACIAPKIARKIVDYLSHTNASTSTRKLTQREVQVAFLIKGGYSYKQVAENCHISVDTVRMHIRNIYKKLQVKSKIQLANRISTYPMHSTALERLTA